MSPHKRVILTFIQGALFWTASGTTIGFFPLLAATLHLSAQDAGLFVVGAAIGRAVFQPCAGMMVTTNNARTLLPCLISLRYQQQCGLGVRQHPC
ncbi:MAG: hypothetical protein ACSLEN_03155 [Candidatus Malihini olakiniferum]